MSSSFRNPLVRAAAFRFAGCALLLTAPAAWSQQVIFLPGFETSSEWSSNRSLSTTDEDSTMGYRGILDARIRRITPRSDTELHPQVSYQKYSDRSDLDNVEAHLDMRSRYETLKGRMELLGRFRRQDTFNAELGQASFDTDDPDIPDDVETGVIQGGITRTNFLIQPGFSYSFSPRMDLEATAQYEYLDYDTNEDLQGFRSGFTSPSVDLQLVRKMTERFQLGVGPYYSRYERDDNSNESDSYGGLINLRWQTSEITRGSLLLRVEQNKDVILEPVRVEDKSTAWGLEWVGVRQHRLGQTQYRIGRFLQATSLGGRRKVDQAHVQYDRPLSQRTLLRGAVRYMRANDISDLETSDGDERDQARFDLMVRHFFTENFFVSGQYRFAWVDRNASGNAENHAVFLSLGLRKRDPTGGFRE